MRGILLIFLFYFLGYLLQKTVLPLPGNVNGLILLTLFLFLGWVKLEWIEREAEILNRSMLLFFAPVIVGIMPLFPKYQSELLPITAGLLGSTLAVLISTGWMVKTFTGRKIKAEMGAGNLDGEGNLDV